MDCQQALISTSKYVAQAKDLIEQYVRSDIKCRTNYTSLEDAIKLLNNALENVII